MEPSKATREWRQIAQGSDPLYAIDSVPGMKGRWTPEAFYAHGRSDWEAFRHHWDHYDPQRGGTVLEIGCGGGRMTAALAQVFDSTIAVDVSDAMLDRTRAVVPDTVDLRQTDGHSLPADDQSVDAVFSVHVLQHLETKRDVETYVRESFRVLKPGGTVLIHTMVKGSRRSLRRAIRYELQLRRSRLALRFGREHSVMRVRMYWLDDLYRMFDAAGFTDIELRTIHAGPYGHQCWLARCPAAAGPRR